jgi:hypothetical protein
MIKVYTKLIRSGAASSNQLRLVDANKITADDKCKGTSDGRHYVNETLELIVNTFLAQIHWEITLNAS